MKCVFDISIQARELAVKVVEENFPVKHYENIMCYEAWPMRKIMENLIEIALQEAEEARKKQEALSQNEASKLLEDVLDILVEVGNGTTDEMLKEAANKLFKFRDGYFKLLKDNKC